MTLQKQSREHNRSSQSWTHLKQGRSKKYTQAVLSAAKRWTLGDKQVARRQRTQNKKTSMQCAKVNTTRVTSLQYLEFTCKYRCMYWMQTSECIRTYVYTNAHATLHCTIQDIKGHATFTGKILWIWIDGCESTSRNQLLWHMEPLRTEPFPQELSSQHKFASQTRRKDQKHSGAHDSLEVCKGKCTNC